MDSDSSGVPVSVVVPAVAPPPHAPPPGHLPFTGFGLVPVLVLAALLLAVGALLLRVRPAALRRNP